METRLPSGPTRVETRLRTATMASLGDLPTLTTLTESRSLNGQTWVTLWDATSRVETTTSPMGRQTSRQLTAFGQTAQAAVPGVLPLTVTHRPDGTTVTTAYDAAGRVATVTTPTWVYAYGYHHITGQLAQLSGPGDQTLSFSHDGSLPLSTAWSREVTGSVSWSFLFPSMQ